MLSPNNTEGETESKFLFYERYGVEEYYVIDPDEPSAQAFFRREGTLVPVTRLNGYVSPRLGIRFELSPDDLRLYTPTGRLFQDRTDRIREMEEELKRTAAGAEQERHRAAEAERVAEAYRAKLRQMEFDPDQLR